jgi:hypothetical protein
MNDAQPELNELVVAAFEKHFAEVCHAGGQAWEFVLSNGALYRASAGYDDEWLHLTATVRRLRSRRTPPLWDYLTANGTLRGGVKFALTDSHTLSLCADISLDEETDMARRLHEACNGLMGAAEGLHAENASPAGWHYPVIVASGAGKSESRDLRSLCRIAGWEFHERPDGRLVVDLDVPLARGFWQAVVEGSADGVSVSTDLTEVESLSAASRQALAMALLGVGGQLRMARAAAPERGAHANTRFEVVFDSPPCAGELDHALAALSTACAQCGPEVGALCDEKIAAEFLTLQGGA